MKRRLGDRRGRPRFEIVGDLWGTLDTTTGVPLLNIGRGGALVQSDVQAEPLTVHRVTFRCGIEHTDVSVQVRHVRQVAGVDGRDYYLMGLEFLSVPAPLMAQINAWLSADPSLAAGGA